MNWVANSDAELAAKLATAAGEILLALRESQLISGISLGKLGDYVANRFLCAALSEHRPEDGLLSEETRDTQKRLDKSRVWIIDPVDGTREYGENRTDWAVHVAMTINGVAEVGAVALPGLGITLRSDKFGSVPPAGHPLRVVVSRTRPAEQAIAVAKEMNAELIPMGSAGAKVMAIIRGEADIYLHSGGQYEWDSCAPVAVAMAHGLHVSRIDGSPLIYNQADTYMPDLLVCRQEHADAVLKAAGMF